jgi:hypothetical protein
VRAAEFTTDNRLVLRLPKARGSPQCGRWDGVDFVGLCLRVKAATEGVCLDGLYGELPHFVDDARQISVGRVE